MADPFARFTERARHVLTLAQEEAERRDHRHIGTEHILLGLGREDGGVAGIVLSMLRVDMGKLRSSSDAITERGAVSRSGKIGLTPRAQRTIEYAVVEAKRLNHHYIGTEHLLLGLLRVRDGVATTVLESYGVTLDGARWATERVLSDAASPHPAAFQPSDSIPVAPPASATENAFGDGFAAGRSLSPDVAVLVTEALRDVARLGYEQLTAGRLLFALVEPDQRLAAALDDASGDLKRAEQSYERRTQLLSRGSRLLTQLRTLKEQAIASQHFEDAARLRHQELHLRTEIDRLNQGDDTLLEMLRPPGATVAGQLDTFTERARRLFVEAQQETNRFGNDLLGAAYLLRALLRLPESTARGVLAASGIDISALALAVESTIEDGGARDRQTTGQSSGFEGLIAFAVDEARRLDHHSMGTAHLLLGMLRDSNSIAGSVLQAAGLEIEQARAVVRSATSAEPDQPVTDRDRSQLLDATADQPEAGGPVQDVSLAPAVQRALSFGMIEMRSAGAQSISAADLAWVLLDADPELAARLTAGGLDLDRCRNELERQRSLSRPDEPPPPAGFRPE